MNSGRSGSLAALRIAAAAYIFYLGWTVLRDTLNGSSTIPVWVGWLAGLVFMGASLAYGVYSFRRYRQEQKAAQAQEPSPDEEDAP